MVLVGLLSVRQWCAALLDSACALHKSAPDPDLTAKPEREKISQIFFFLLVRRWYVSKSQGRSWCG